MLIYPEFLLAFPIDRFVKMNRYFKEIFFDEDRDLKKKSVIA